ncbi:armadillo-type protein [Amanita rubescens]|nr:armadillo-type protein [Amanita rubescens]
MALTSQIAESLAATLNPDGNVRIAAELRLANYFTNPESGLALSQLIVTQDADISLRQQHSASIALRKYVKERWSPIFPSFRGSAPQVEIKSKIRQAVFLGLSDPERKIRSLCAHTLSSIAHSDWHDEYPELLPSLINLLSSGSPISVHGAMQVFAEFIKSELTEDQTLPILRELLPVLLSILGSTELYSAPTRARTVSVFRQCMTVLYMVKDQHPQAVKEATSQVLPVWLDAFKVLLNLDLQREVQGSENWDGLSIRIQVFKTLDTLHTSFPRALTPYLPDFLNSALHHLQIIYPSFVHYYISAADSPPRTSEDELIELPDLIVPIVDFIAAVARGGKAKLWFDAQHFPALVSAVFKFTQVGEQDEETWETNPYSFVSEEDDKTQGYNLRDASFDLLNCFMDRNPVQTTQILQQTMEQTIHDCDAERSAGNKNWWRPLEAALASVGSQAGDIQDCIDEVSDAGRLKPFDIESSLTKVIPPILRLSDYPFLQGRGFVFASQFASSLPPQLAGQYLEAAIQAIEMQDARSILKISAVKAVQNFCDQGEDGALVPFAGRIARDLGPLLLSTSEDTLLIVLETISSVLRINETSWLDTELANALVLAILQVWNKNIRDPIFISILADIMSLLASSPSNGVNEIVVKQAVPVLTNALASAKPIESWITSSAIDLLNSIVEGRADGLQEGFFAHVAPGLFKCLSDAEDRDILQNGIKCLTSIIQKDCSQIVAWHDETGRSGLDYVLMFIARTLDNQDESGGLVIGDLIIHLLRKTGESVLPVLPQLLQSMVNRMTTAKTATFIQSLIVPFAFLINNQRDTVLSLVESMQVQHRTALEILVNTWCENAETFQGFWASRISALALSQLFLSDRQSLQKLTVKGDIIVKPETQNVIMTRSRAKQTPHEFTSVPFHVKALKLLVRELQLGGESATITARGGAAEDLDSDDGDENWEEEDKLKDDEISYLSDMIGPKGPITLDNGDLASDMFDDEDLRRDPVYNMDIQAHLANFIKECAARNTNNFASIVEQLNAEEMLVIRGVVQG